MYDDIQPEDFKKELDPELFAKWKEAKRQQQRAKYMPFVFWAAGFIIFILTETVLTFASLIGLLLFMGLSITGLLVLVPKNKKVTKIQNELGITNREVYDIITEMYKKPKK